MSNFRCLVIIQKTKCPQPKSNRLNRIFADTEFYDSV